MLYKKTKRCWTDIKKRCDNKLHKFYKDYGKRGIKYCDEWKLFYNFLSDMGEKPDGKSIDRINVDGNYCKENCRWATPAEQQRNTRRNIKYKGECARDASYRLGGNKNLVQSRIGYGWDIEKAFTTPCTDL